jgi:hypothetical protein
MVEACTYARLWKDLQTQQVPIFNVGLEVALVIPYSTSFT